MREFVLVILISMFLISCQTQAERASSSESSQATSGKMTPANSQTGSYRLGLSIRLAKADGVEGPKIAKEFEDQLGVFEPCLKVTGKTEVVRLKAEFKLEKSGVIEHVKVIETVPASPEFAACFLRQIEELDLGRRSQVITGILTLGTYYGTPKGWGPNPKKYE